MKLKTKKTSQSKKWDKELNRYFSKECIQMTRKHMKRQPTSLIIREMQVKTTMSIISLWSEWPPSKSLQTINAGEGAGKGTLLHYWLECKLIQSLWRTVWRCLKKLEIELPYDTTIPLLGIYTKETRIERDTCAPVFIVALFTRIHLSQF